MCLAAIPLPWFHWSPEVVRKRAAIRWNPSMAGMIKGCLSRKSLSMGAKLWKCIQSWGPMIMLVYTAILQPYKYLYACLGASYMEVYSGAHSILIKSGTTLKALYTRWYLIQLHVFVSWICWFIYLQYFAIIILLNLYLCCRRRCLFMAPKLQTIVVYLTTETFVLCFLTKNKGTVCDAEGTYLCIHISDSKDVVYYGMQSKMGAFTLDSLPWQLNKAGCTQWNLERHSIWQWIYDVCLLKQVKRCTNWAAVFEEMLIQHNWGWLKITIVKDGVLAPQMRSSWLNEVWLQAESKFVSRKC